MQVDDPPYLSVGTAVSAKYKGAFCEAKVSKVVRIVKCKVTYKMGLGTATLSDDQIKGTLRVGQTVQAKHPDKKELVEATITKIQDCSQYTVVFDDGDITTLRRTALCLKSGRHFNESETLDQLPLTHPEHFGNPVVGGRRGRRSRQPKEDSSEGEAEEENEPDLEAYLLDIGRVVSVEASDKKKNKDNWFPGLVVIPSAQPTVRINCKDEYLIRSFKDGRYYTVPKKEVTEFTREMADKVENPSLTEAIQKAIQFLDNNELPPHWERNTLFHSQTIDSESDENLSETTDDEPNEEKDLFVAQLYKFMDEAGTPLNKTPSVANRDIDLYRLFQLVRKLGGFNRVNNQNKWKTIATRLHYPINQSTLNQVKAVYKKCLYSYEGFHRTLGVTMLNHTRSNKKNRGRSLIRDKDRSTPISSPAAPEKDEDSPEEKKEENKIVKKIEKKKATSQTEVSDTCSSDTADPVESKDSGRPKREKIENRITREKKAKGANGEKVKALIEKFEEQTKIEDEEKVQYTRSKSKSRDLSGNSDKKPPEGKEGKRVKTPTKPPKKQTLEDEKKKGKKRSGDSKSRFDSSSNVNLGDKLKVYYGPTNESKVTYEAKVIEIDKDQSGPVFLVHYTGWNTRYDEWIQPHRIAENLSATTKAKRLKHSLQTSANAVASGSKTSKISTAAKRKRGGSVTSRSSMNADAPRSTTPSSVTSSSSRTKSPAVPATRSARLRKQDASKRSRRTSAQTDISLHTEDSESEESASESDLIRTRSSAKLDEPELKTYKRKPSKTMSKVDKKKEEDDTEKEEDSEKFLKRSRRLKRSPEKSTEESEDEGNPPKGRDFDLNQIRSELKGFSKAIKVAAIDPLDKDVSSSDDSTNPPMLDKPSVDNEEGKEQEQEKSSTLPVEKSPPSSEDIYEFKEPEPFEFETRPKLIDEKNSKKRLVPRLFEDHLEKSPRKKSPKMSPKQESSFRKTSLRRQDSSDEDEPLRSETPVQKEVDPFDKLVESPSFNLVKTTDKPIEKQSVIRNLSEDSVSLFRELPETEDDCSKDMELSDCESQTQIFTRETELFSDTFPKSSPEQNTMDMEFSSGKTENDDLREQIQRAIAQSSSTDDESNDELFVTPTTSTYQTQKKEEISSISSILSINTLPSTSQVTEQQELNTTNKNELERVPKVESLKEESDKTIKPTISPALQETDSSLLESIVSQPPVALDIKLEETAKDLNIKTGTKIADSILQKFNSIKKNELEEKMQPKADKSEPLTSKNEKLEFKFDKDDSKHITAESELPEGSFKKGVQKLEVKTEEESVTTQKIESPDMKKRKKVLSRAFIDESDSDSSDSEQLVIARSDEDSQTNSLDMKPDLKENDNSNMFAQLQTDDSQSQDERNFNFNQNQEVKTAENEQSTLKEEKAEASSSETIKEEEPDPHLHSLLLCEEEIPRSPAPATESIATSEMKPTKSEMPFASAPGTSNGKSMLLEQNPQQKKLVDVPLMENRTVEASAVMDNTPPTTPESTMSLSPQREIGDLSPNTGDNESCKSNDEFSRLRGNSTNKVSPYSEEDTLMNSEQGLAMKKPGQENTSPPFKKRRKSLRSEEAVPPTKRGKKGANRSRQNSDSDDTSEHSNGGNNSNAKSTSFTRGDRSPRPSKYNFFVEFDPSLDSSQRIAVLQQKLSELRKTYADVKAELAAVERRRKKIRRREREALKAAKQEMACA